MRYDFCHVLVGIRVHLKGLSHSVIALTHRFYTHFIYTHYTKQLTSHCTDHLNIEPYSLRNHFICEKVKKVFGNINFADFNSFTLADFDSLRNPFICHFFCKAAHGYHLTFSRCLNDSVFHTLCSQNYFRPAFSSPFSTSIRMVSPAPTWSARMSFAASVSTVFCR